MTEDEAIRRNRLALLAELVKKVETIAAFDRLNTK